MRKYKNKSARIYCIYAIVFAIFACIFFGLGLLVYLSEGSAVLFFIGLSIFAVSAVYCFVKCLRFRVGKHDKIYDAKYLSVDCSSFGRSTKFSIKVSYTDEYGKEITGVTGYIFYASHFNKIKDSKSLKIAVKPDNEVVILEIV